MKAVDYDNYYYREGVEDGQTWAEKAHFFEKRDYIAALRESNRFVIVPYPNEAALDYVANYSDDPDWNNATADLFWQGFADGAKGFIENQIKTQKARKKRQITPEERPTGRGKWSRSR